MYDGNAIVRSWTLGTLAQDFPALTAEQRRAIGLVASGSTDEKALDAAGADFVCAVKAAHGFARNLFSVGGALVEKAPEGSPVIPWVFSSQKVDRDGSVVMQGGWELENYRKNPVIDWAHSWARGASEEPYARGENLRVETVNGVPALVGDIRFAIDESEDAARRYRLAKSGFINAGSVGFSGLETRFVEDEEERKRIGLGRFGVVHERHELLEFSLCTVPAHPDAVQRALKDAVAAGQIEEKDADLAAALASPTEKEWEKRARARQRAFVDMGAASKGRDSIAQALADELRQSPALRRLLREDSREEILPLKHDASGRCVIRTDAPATPEAAAVANAGDMQGPVTVALLSHELHARTEADHRLSDSLEMLAKAITDLSTNLGRANAASDDARAPEAKGKGGTDNSNLDMQLAAIEAARRGVAAFTEPLEGAVRNARHRPPAGAEKAPR